MGVYPSCDYGAPQFVLGRPTCSVRKHYYYWQRKSTSRTRIIWYNKCDIALLSVTEAARKAGQSTSLIRKALAEGKVRGVKIDHSWIVDEGSLDAFIASPRLPGRPRKDTA